MGKRAEECECFFIRDTKIVYEKSDRKIAEKKGVRTIGLLGILEANYRLEFISYRDLLYILDEFKRVGYRLNSKLEKSFLEGL